MSHPHPAGHADEPHSHEYLFDSLLAGASGLAPNWTPVENLLKLLRTTRVGWYLVGEIAFSLGLEPAPTAPPPRRIPS